MQQRVGSRKCFQSTLKHQWDGCLDLIGRRYLSSLENQNAKWELETLSLKPIRGISQIHKYPSSLGQSPPKDREAGESDSAAGAEPWGQFSLRLHQTDQMPTNVFPMCIKLLPHLGISTQHPSFRNCFSPLQHNRIQRNYLDIKGSHVAPGRGKPRQGSLLKDFGIWNNKKLKNNFRFFWHFTFATIWDELMWSEQQR